MKSMLISLLFKTIIITLLILAGYYFLVLKPNTKRLRTLSAEYKQITQIYDQLVQDRFQFTEFTQLNPSNPQTPITHEYLLNQLKTRSQKTSPLLTAPTTQDDVRDIFERHKQLLSDQLTLLEQINSLNSYPKQIELINHSKDFFTQQTNLINDYSNLLTNLKKEIDQLQ